MACNPAGQEKSYFSKFLKSVVCRICQGKGHRAKECPSRDPAPQRDGSRYRKCGVLRQWVRFCLSPGQGGKVKRGAPPAAQPVTPEKEAGERGNGLAYPGKGEASG